MPNKRRESPKLTQNEFLPSTTASSEKQDYLLRLANEIPKVADKVKWFKRPEMSEFGQMTETCAISGFSCLGEVTDTSAAEREPLRKTLARERPAWARIFGQIPDSRAPPAECKAKPAPFKEVGIYAALQGIDALSGIGEIQRPRQEAADMFPADLHGGDNAEPSYTASWEPTLNGAPWAPRDAARNHAAEQGKARQKRRAVGTSPLDAGQLALHYLRYITAGEVAGAWQRPGGVVAALTHLVH